MSQRFHTSLKSNSVTSALSLGVGALVWALWGTGVLASLEEVFLTESPAGANAAPQGWVVLLLVASAGLGAGYAVERMGGRRGLRVVGLALVILCVASLVVSHLLRFNIVYAPLMLSALGSFAAAQALRLWALDAALTRNIRHVASRPSALEGGAANARLMCGLKLLDTVLPVEESVVFQLDEAGALAQAARLRPPAQRAAGAEGDPNFAWREAVAMCERSIRSDEIAVHTDAADGRSTVALPLVHEGGAVGALLLRLGEGFDESDRQLLLNVGAQLARDLQRELARSLPVPRARETFFSSRAAGQRLESFGVVSGLLTEQGFAARVLSEAQDAHAVAYLDGTLAHVNPAMLEAARVGREECRALDLFGLLERFRTGVFDEPQIAVRRVLQSGQAYERELTFIDREQTLALRIALVTDGAVADGGAESSSDKGVGTPLCLAVTVRDVTRIKDYELLKSDMLSLMSHELRTPITSINGFAELLMGDENIPEESREFLSIIHGESQRLARMIGTFLSVARLEQKDRQEVLMAPLMLDEVVREAISNFQPAAKKKRIRLVEKDGSRLPPVAADRGLITQAVANLLDNAIKYSPERTSVMLSTDLEAEAVRLTVEDRGYGIPPGDQDRVWEKFYRVSRDGRVKEEESTGLGLSFVREVVEQHGGQVFLESEVGRGSKIGFTLPRL